MKASVLSLLAWVLVPFLALAQDKADLNTISSVRVNGGTVEIVGTKKPNFTTFTMTDPPRLVIDISEAVFAGVPEELTVGNGTVSGIRTASYGSEQNAIARILIGYDKEVETDIAASGNQLVVKVLGGTGPAVAAAPRNAAAQPAGTGATGTPGTGTTPGTGAAQAAEAARTEPGTGAAKATVAARDDLQAQEKAAAEATAAARNDRQAQEKAAAEATAAARLAAEEDKKRQAEAERVAVESRREAEAQATKAAVEDRKRQEAEARAAALADKKRQEDELRAAAESKKLAAEDERERKRQEAAATAEAKKQSAEDARERKRQEAAAAVEAKKQQQEEARAAAEAKKQAEADARAVAAADRKRQQEEARASRQAEAPRVAQAEPRPRAEPRPTRPVGGSDEEASVSSRRKTMTLVGFQQQPSSSRVFIRTNEPVRYTVSEGNKQVVLELENTRIDMSNNTHPLDTSFFETAVARVDPQGAGAGTRVIIQLKEQVSFQTRQEGSVISLEFQRPSRR